MSIRSRTRITVLVLIVLIDALVGATVWAQRQATDRAVDAVESVRTETLPLIEAGQGASDFAIVVGTRLFAPETAVDGVPTSAGRVDEQIRLLEDADLGRARAATEAAIARWRRWSPVLIDAPPGVGLDDPEMVEAVRQVLLVEAGFTEARVLSLDTVDGHLAAARTQQRRSLAMVIVMAVVCGLSVLVAAYLLTRSFLRPVERLRRGVAVVARGDLDHRLPVGGPAELAELADGFNGMARDLRDRERQLIYRALHDPLTGAGNRALFHDRLDQRLTRLERHPGDHVGVLLLDLDGFKAVNDALGHNVGDEALRVVCDRIRGLLRDNDTLVRLGGDEFAVIVDGPQPEVTPVAQRICSRLRGPIAVGDQQVTLTASVGLTTTEAGATNVEDLLRHADIAMYAAKRSGGDRVTPFVRIMGEQLGERRSMAEELRRAVDLDQIEVHYQPTVTLSSQEILGVEALVRWRHPRHGILEPGRFLDIAEETGLIIPIGEHVLRQATRDAAVWAQQDPRFVLAVNVSARQLQDDRLAGVVTSALHTSGFPADQLMLEITETVLLNDLEEAATRLVPLHDLGVRIALDDFGTGYTSLQYLGTLPIDTLKIDRSFVDGLAYRADQRSLVRAIMDLALRMDCDVIAEGIEQVDDAEALRALGCETGQGFAYHRPVPRDAIDRLVGVDAVARAQPVLVPGTAP